MNSSRIRPVLASLAAVLLVAVKAEAQTCRATEAIDRDHPYEVGGLLEFGEGSSSIGGTATVGTKREFVGGAVERVTSGGGLVGSATTAALRLRADAGAEFSARKGTLAICPFTEIAHVGAKEAVDPQGSLSIEGGVTVGFVGLRSDDFRFVPVVGGGVVRSREARASPRGATTIGATSGLVQVGLGLIRQDSASFVISYAIAFNSAIATSTLSLAVNFAVGHK